MPPDVAQILIPFGFTNLESEIYTFLLRESPATGYRIGQELGKAAANTYKAVRSLQQKGAVLVEDAASRSYRAVPSDELLARLTRDFEWRRAEAEMRLAEMNTGVEDDRIYSLRSSAQVIERARHMIGSAEAVVLLACTAGIADQVSDALLAAVRKKIRVLVACPEPIGIEGVQAVAARKAGVLDEIRLVSDASESLFGLLRPKNPHAVWSRSTYLAVCAHRGLAAEMAHLGLAFEPVESAPGYLKLLGSHP